MGATSSPVKKGQVVEFHGPPDHIKRFHREGDVPLEHRLWYFDVKTGRPQEIERTWTRTPKGGWADPQFVSPDPPDRWLRLDYEAMKKLWDRALQNGTSLVDTFLEMRDGHLMPAWVLDATTRSPKVYACDREGEEGFRSL